jgi:hypothetical protein
MVVRWRTDVATDTRLIYGSSPTELGDPIVDLDPATEHEVTVGPLESGTRYYYGVGTSTLILAGRDADHYFETSPASGSDGPFRIWVVGDSGQCAVTELGCTDAGAVRDRYLEYAQGDIANVWLALGDSAYNIGTDQQFTDGLFEVYPEVQRNTPLWPVPGNHEYASSGAGPYYAAFSLPTMGEAGGVPSGTEAYYSFDYANMHFIALDSHGTDRSDTGSMYAWLEADLMATTADWVIAYWHHPPYSKGSHDSDSSTDSAGRMWDMRQIFLPLIESYGVDLQLTGHSHSYERSVLIDGHYGVSSTYDPLIHAKDTGDGDPAGDGAYAKPTLGSAPHEGTVYSVVGSSSKNSGGALNHPVMEKSINYEGSMLIDIDGSVLEAVFIDKDGVIDDHFRIEKPTPPVVAPTADAAALTGLAGVLLLSGALLVKRQREPIAA